jgi:hypothetical protein
MVARVFGAALILLAPTLPGAVHPLAAQSQAGTTWEQHRTNLERTIQEIESGQMLWVPDGPRLVPVRRDDYRNALLLTVLAPLDRVSKANLYADHIPEPASRTEVLRLARAAVAATEAFRRALRAELVSVNAYLRSNKPVGPLVFDPRSAQHIRDYLQTTWRLQLVVTDQSSEFREQADILRQARDNSTLLVTAVTCQPIDPPKVNCNLAGRVNWRGPADAAIVVRNADQLVEDLRMASLSSPGLDNNSLVRFRISADFAGGSLDFSGNLNAATGAMEGGRMSWAASGRSIDVGTWSAVRAPR